MARVANGKKSSNTRAFLLPISGRPFEAEWTANGWLIDWRDQCRAVETGELIVVQDAGQTYWRVILPSGPAARVPRPVKVPGSFFKSPHRAIVDWSIEPEVIGGTPSKIGTCLDGLRRLAAIAGAREAERAVFRDGSSYRRAIEGCVSTAQKLRDLVLALCDAEDAEALAIRQAYPEAADRHLAEPLRGARPSDRKRGVLQPASALRNLVTVIRDQLLMRQGLDRLPKGQPQKLRAAAVGAPLNAMGLKPRERSAVVRMLGVEDGNNVSTATSTATSRSIDRMKKRDLRLAKTRK